MNEEAGIAYALIITLLGTIFVILRFSIRWNGWNNRANSARYVYILSDVFIVVSLVFTLAFCGFELWLRVGAIKRRGDPSLRVGRKAWDWQVKKLKGSYFANVAYATALWGVKASFLCTYWLAARGYKENIKVQYSLLGTVFFTASSFVVAVLIFAFSCLPVRRYWSLTTDNCLLTNNASYSYTTTILHLTSDLLIIFQGIITIHVSHTSSMQRFHRREYFAIAFIFLLGFLTFASACVRFSVQLSLADNVKQGKLLSSKEGTDLGRWSMMAGLMELALALVAVALPSMRVWLRRLIATPQGSGVEGSRMSRLSRITIREQERRGGAEVMPRREVTSTATEDKIRYGWEYSCEVTAGDQRENRRTVYPGWPVRWSDSVGDDMERRREMRV